MRAPFRLARLALHAAHWEPVRLDRGDVWFRQQSLADEHAAGQLEREAGALRLRSLFVQQQFDMVVDVGAHEGGFASRVRGLGYRGGILSLEPNPAAYRVVAARAGLDANWDVRQIAAGDVNAKLPFHITRDAQFASVNRPGANGGEFGDMMDVVEVVDVSVCTIDELDAAENFVTTRTLLKVDTQGFDHAVLSGASRTLRRVAAVMFEVPIIAIYDGTPHYAATFALLESHGLKLYSLTPISRQSDSGCIIEADALWVRG